MPRNLQSRCAHVWDVLKSHEQEVDKTLLDQKITLISRRHKSKLQLYVAIVPGTSGGLGE